MDAPRSTVTKPGVLSVLVEQGEDVEEEVEDIKHGDSTFFL